MEVVAFVFRKYLIACLIKTTNRYFLLVTGKHIILLKSTLHIKHKVIFKLFTMR